MDFHQTWYVQICRDLIWDYWWANFITFWQRSAHDTSDFSFLDNLSKYQWTLIKLGLYIDIVEIWFGIANGQISSIFDRLSTRDRFTVTSIFLFLNDNLSKYQWIFTKLGMCIDIVEIWFGIANGQILSIFDRVICRQHIRLFVSGQ